jgi:hypothetical protein
MQTKLSPANVLILGGGALMLIGSFLAFYTLDDPFGGEFGISAWDRPAPFGVFGIATVAMLCGVIMAVQVGLGAFSNIDMPGRLLGFTWDQLHFAFGSQAALLMVTFLVRDKGALGFGVGFWCMLAGATAAFVGALMRVGAAGRRPRSI